jgi:hypothetical protein
MKKKKVRFAKIKINVKAKKEKAPLNTCARCEKHFASRQALKTHSKSHLNALHELKMLEEGKTPEETKLGSEFKGKNKVIVA